MLILGENCLKIGSGATPRGGKEVYSADGPISLIRSQNIYNEGFNFNGLARISNEQAKNLENVKIFPNDILLNITGDSVARACLVDQDALPARVNQHVAIIRTNPEKINPLFLRYYLITPTIQNHLLALSSAGATRNALTKAMIESLLIPNYTLYKQRTIASILAILDEKINLNRRTNETLEAMARALFRDWFIDFGPIRAKMAGEAPYLAPELWELFPDRLDDEGKPEGWHISSIGDEADIVGGSTPSTSNPIFWNGNHFWATPKDLSGLNSPVLSDTSRQITDEGLTQISSGLLPSGSVLLSSRAPVGYTAITTIPLAINQGFIGVKCAKSLSAPYVLLWMKESMELILQNANGSTFQEISKKNFRPLPIIKASHDLLKAFDIQSQGIFDKIIVNEAESRNLAQLRDLLLPKLMSGEISIRDAEKMVEDAA